ncbi:MAG: binding-protein-dependent transport system inner rane component [Candidatus Solibacter sp.]|nr:binding-protein-dependent transport system inner rane component [Candidatus Solibacter sp.]
MRYAAGRVVHSLLLLIGVSVLSFLFAELAPGDFYSEMPLNAQVSRATVDAMRAERGLDRPLPLRYAAWVGSVARGEFGYSLAYNAAVGPLLRRRIPGTLLLTATATLLAWMLAIPIGIWNASKRGSWSDSLVKVVLSILLAIPEILLGVIFLVLAVETGWLPAGGMHSPGVTGIGDTLRHLVIPVSVLVLGMLPVLVRHVRAAMIEAMDAPFALAARAQGIPARRVLFRHLLPVALNPLITLFGFSLGALLSGSLLIEVIVGWPGLGPLFVEAILARDFALVLGVVMASTTLLIAGNLAADLLLYRADPRISDPGIRKQ